MIAGRWGSKELAFPHVWGEVSFFIVFWRPLPLYPPPLLFESFSIFPILVLVGKFYENFSISRESFFPNR